MGGSDIVKHKGGVLTNLFDFFPKIVYRTYLKNIQIFTKIETWHIKNFSDLQYFAYFGVLDIYYNILITKVQLLTKLIFQILLEIEVNIW